MADTLSQMFTELYRPKNINQAILLPRVREQLEKGLTQNILFYGKPGTGKTTMTRIMAAGHPTHSIRCSQVGIDAVRDEINGFASQLSLDDDGTETVKVIILEECDGFTPQAWNAMRETVETYHQTLRFIGNCNYIEKIPEPIQSRFNCISLEPMGQNLQEERNYLVTEYGKRVAAICKYLQINFTDEDVLQFVNRYFPDLRKIMEKLQELFDRGCKELKEINTSSTFDYSQLFDLILKGGQPYENFRLICDNYGDKVDDCISQIGEYLPEYIRQFAPDYQPKIPLIIITTAEHAQQAALVINKKITLCSLVFKLQQIVHS